MGEAAGWKEWFREHAASFRGSVQFDERLARHTYYRVGGPADVLFAPSGRADLERLSEGVAEWGRDRPWVTVVGLGSNLLVSDRGVRGVVVKTGRLNLDISGGTPKLVTGASVAVSTLLRRAGAEGWRGLELLAGVPGSVGGVVVMNAGTHLGEAKDHLETVQSYDWDTGEWHSRSGGDLRFEYRRNHFLGPHEIVWSAEWRVEKGEPGQVLQEIDSLLTRRKETQPVEYPSCGSVFKNPMSHGLHAWQAVERVGLRGHRVGGAQFSEKHCNFIINLGGAAAADIRALIDLAKARAKEQLGVELEEEVRTIGDWS